MREFDLINRITSGEPISGDLLLRGIGDDCAIMDFPGSNRNWLVTTDALIEGVHFDFGWTDIYRLGRKSLSVNLSDIAAMGGTPRFYLAAVSIPSSFSEEDMAEFYRGMRDVAGEYGVVLIGGDTTGSRNDLCIAITAIGDVEEGSAVLRSTARPGDGIFVSGPLGDASLALEILKGENIPPIALMERFVDPSPKVRLGERLRASGLVTSMIDISDGLLQDFGHIADASGVGFDIRAGDVQMSVEYKDACGSYDLDPFKYSLTGGEDYELLFTVRGDRVDEFRAAFCKDVYMIGEVVADRKLRRVMGDDGKVLEYGIAGFDHFGG